MTPQSGIIFEGTFRDSFMYHAINEGLAIPLDEDDVTKDMFAIYRRAEKRIETLELCLLYDKVSLYSYGDAFDLSKLRDENLVDFIVPTDIAEIRPRKSGPLLSLQDFSTCQLLKPVVFPYLKRKNQLLHSTAYDKIISLLATEDVISILNKDYIADSLNKKLLSVWSKGEITQDISKVLSVISRKERNRATISSVFSVLDIHNDLFTVIDLLKYSSQLSVPLATQKIGASSLKTSSDFVLSSQELFHAYYKVFKIVLREVEYFPVVDSLSDVLRLRSDKRIVDFRENLIRWATALHNSDATEEKKLRREIEKSNRALRSIHPLKKVGAYMTYLALPLSIVPELGFPLTALSVAIQLYTDVVGWRNRWLMVGR